jgi:hypothetical protein
MDTEKNWGRYHIALMYAKLGDATLADVDQRIKEQVLSQVEDSKTETEKAQRILMLQILGDSGIDEDYERAKNGGWLGRIYFAQQILGSNKELWFSHIYTDPKNNARFKTKFGYLVTSDNIHHDIIGEQTENSVGRGSVLILITIITQMSQKKN